LSTKSPDHLDAGAVDRRLQGSAQHVEVPARDAGLEVHPRLDDRLAAPLHGEARLDGVQNLVVGDVQLFDVEPVEEGDVIGGVGLGGHGNLGVEHGSRAQTRLKSHSAPP
jgi:hypothetical protein